MNDVLVEIEFGEGFLAVPLSQLTCITQRGSTLRGVSDWHYWVSRGYAF
jgi:hypothetical protein